MKTAENNKLIAEFMGVKFHEKNQGDVYDVLEYSKTGVLHARYLKFHSSWNWLMPVLIKISQTELKWISLDCFAVFEVHESGCTIKVPEGDGWTSIAFGGDPVDATYFTVVEFIEWYNKNK